MKERKIVIKQAQADSHRYVTIIPRDESQDNEQMETKAIGMFQEFLDKYFSNAPYNKAYCWW